MALTSLALAFSVDVTLSDETALALSLPQRVGAWTGYDVVYCQNPRCRREFRTAEIEEENTCPACGSEGLAVMSLGERQLLPADTILLKKRYFNEAGDDIFVAVVFSGRERVSIHRPQICLKGQGRRLHGEYTLAVPIEGRSDLDIMVLDIIHPVTGPDGQTIELPRYYAYWFVGKDRETPYHWQRMLWMGTDRIFRSVSHRWAYISVGGQRQLDDAAHQEELKAFVAEFYPQILKTPIGHTERAL
jgi:hypothetical protein